MEINKVWAMPNLNTFDILPIKLLINKYTAKLEEFDTIIDPFANTNKIANITNDINPECKADYCLDAIDFLKSFGKKSINMVLYDPPYSPRQVSECYKKMERTVDMKTTQSSYWSNQKKEISRIVKKDGYVITCSWNSGGIGKKYDFEMVEILLVAHGGWHNDTIVTVEIKK